MGPPGNSLLREKETESKRKSKREQEADQENERSEKIEGGEDHGIAKFPSSPMRGERAIDEAPRVWSPSRE